MYEQGSQRIGLLEDTPGDAPDRSATCSAVEESCNDVTPVDDAGRNDLLASSDVDYKSMYQDQVKKFRSFREMANQRIDDLERTLSHWTQESIASSTIRQESSRATLQRALRSTDRMSKPMTTAQPRTMRAISSIQETVDAETTSVELGPIDADVEYSCTVTSQTPSGVQGDPSEATPPVAYRYVS